MRGRVPTQKIMTESLFSSMNFRSFACPMLKYYAASSTDSMYFSQTGISISSPPLI